MGVIETLAYLALGLLLGIVIMSLSVVLSSMIVGLLGVIKERRAKSKAKMQFNVSELQGRVSSSQTEERSVEGIK